MFKNFIGSLVFSIFLFSCKANTDSQKSVQITSQPNILLIHVDDLGYHDLSINGSKIYETPHIDSLARQSVVFKNAYANFPRCVPSRYAMITGTWPIVDGKVPDDGFSLDAIKVSNNLIEAIGKSGYHTAFFGKWHLGSGDQSPTGFGFDFSYAAGEAGSPISYFFPFNEPTRENAKVKKAPMPNVDQDAEEGDYLTDFLTTKAIDHLSTVSDKPFFLALNYYAVHQPIEAKQQDVDKNKEQISNFDFGNQPEYVLEGTGRTKMRQDNAEYAAMVENMDWNVGRILQYLKENNLEENTLIIFSSDHGGLSNDGTNQRHLATSNYPLRAGKGWLYDGGTRVPLFIKWKDFTPKIDTESIVMLMDIYPTILDIASNTKIENLDGKSLMPVLSNKQNWKDRTVYWHSDNARPRNTGESNASAIRSGTYKLIDFYEKGKVELYDLSKDESEQTNLYQNQPRLRDSLQNQLNQWKKSYQ